MLTLVAGPLSTPACRRKSRPVSMRPPVTDPLGHPTARRQVHRRGSASVRPSPRGSIAARPPSRAAFSPFVVGRSVCLFRARICGLWNCPLVTGGGLSSPLRTFCGVACVDSLPTSCHLQLDFVIMGHAIFFCSAVATTSASPMMQSLPCVGSSSAAAQVLCYAIGANWVCALAGRRIS